MIDMSSAWHAMKDEELLQTLETGRQGLSSEEAQRRLKQYGYNELKEKKGVGVLAIILNQFRDIFVIMLLIAIAISFLVAAQEDAITIGAIVVLNAVVGSIQEYRSEKAMQAMKKLTAPKARVIRDGREAIIDAREVVPGDVVALESGDRVPADGRLTEVVDLKTDEAALTGESTPINKQTGAVDEKTPVADRKNSVFLGTHLTYGRGRAVITSTGMATQFGKIAEMVQAVEEEQTPLKQKLERFAKKLAIIIVVLVIGIFILELVEIGGAVSLESIADTLLVAVALAVSAVPEGLPAVVTITLALGARELAKKNAIIRRLASAETLGATTVICSDKTGTLTKGEMTVRKIYTDGRTIDVTGVGYESKGEFLGSAPIDPGEDTQLSLLLSISTLCSNAQYDGKSVIGDTTEGALIVAASKAGLIKEELEKAYPRVREVPFTSERKRMTTVHRSPEGRVVAYVKGAPEVVLERSSSILRNGEPVNLSENERELILMTNELMASEALRVLGVASKELPSEPVEEFDEEFLETDLVFVGLMGMIDPPREEAKNANELCHEAGIRTIMITGDHKLTAVAIAKELGMLTTEMVLTGVELDSMTDEEFERVVEAVSVYARVSPEHKLRIVKALKERGQVVAMTGDGVNDAPALKQADIGVAMGITGTDVTREAADMVLADDNFATIVNAVRGGRTIYDNILKFTFFLLRSNFDELLVIGSFALMGLELPLTAGMILWINLVTDGGPAVALSMDPPAEDVMKRPPRNPEEGILHGRLASIIVSFLTQFLGTAVVFYVAFYVMGRPLGEARAMAFVQATLRELVVVWNCRSERRNAFKVGFFNNKFLLIAVLVSAGLTIMVPYIGLFGTDPLSLVDYALVVPVSLSGFLIVPEILYGRKILRWS